MSARATGLRDTVLAIVASAMILAATACTGDDAPATEPAGIVNLQGTSQEMLTLPLAEALVRMEDTLGFEVHVPAQIPANGLVELTNLQASTANPAGAPVAVLRYTARQWKVSPGELMFIATQSPRTDAWAPLQPEGQTEVGPAGFSIIEFRSESLGTSLYQFQIGEMHYRWVFQFVGEETPRTGTVVQAIRTFAEGD